MYISRIDLNLRSSNARKDIKDFYELHRSIYSCFPDKENGGAGRIIYRVENDTLMGTEMLCPVIVLSENKPDWDSIHKSAEYLVQSKVKEYNPVITDNMILKFMLRSNPTVKKDSKRVALKTYDERKKWIERKSKIHDFNILDVSVKSENILTSKSRDKMVFNSVLYEGILQVSNQANFKEVLFNGIGSGKSFGFGLLSVARV